MHDQDLDDDGLPDPGQVPFLCVPFEINMKRFAVMEPCTPPAP